MRLTTILSATLGMTHTRLLIGCLVLIATGTVLHLLVVFGSYLVRVGARFIENQVTNYGFMRPVHPNTLRNDGIPHIRLVCVDVHEPEVSGDLQECLVRVSFN